MNRIIITLDNLKRFFSKVNELIETKSDISHKHNAADILTDETHQFVTSEEKEKINSSINIYSKYFLISGESTDRIEIPSEYRTCKEIHVYVDGVKMIKNLHYTISEDYSYAIFKKNYTFVEIELVVFH